MSCDCSKPIIILTGGSGSGSSASTLYTTSATLLGDRVVTANNHDLTFNMGSGDFIVSGTVSATGFDLTRLTTNPGDSTTLWVSGVQDELFLGGYNLSIKNSNDAGNILTLGTDDGVFLDSSMVCTAISNCDVSTLSDVTYITTPVNGDVLTWSLTYNAWIPQSNPKSFFLSDGVNLTSVNPGNLILFNDSGRMTVSLSPGSTTDTFTFKYDEILTRLSYDSGTNILSYIDESGNATNLNLNTSSFSCSNLSSCSINSLGDVSTSGALNGQVLAFNGASWTPTTITVSGGGGSFSCLSLSGCSASALLDIIYPSGPVDGQALIWASSSNAWTPQNVYQGFTVSDGLNTQSIQSGNTLIISGSGRLSTHVQATDTVMLAYKDVLTTLTYDSGTNILTYTNESGVVSNLTLSTGGGGSFSCSSLNTCSVGALSDVTLFGTPSDGNALIWSSVYSAFIPNNISTFFILTDGTNSQSIYNSNLLTVQGSGRLKTSVQSFNTLNLSYTDILTSLSYDSGTNTLSYVNESGSTTNIPLNYFVCSDLNSCSINSMSDVSTSGATNGQVLAFNGAAWTPTTISVSGGSSFNCLDLSGCSASALLDVIYPSGPTDGQALVWASSSSAFIPQNIFSYFNITDGTTSQSILHSNVLTFSGVGNTAVNVQATDTVVIRHTDVLTSLSFDSGTNILSYVNESGNTTNLSLNIPSGGATFTCSDLNSCSVDSLSDVVLFGTPTNGQALTWSNTYSAFIPQTPFTSFTLSDGTNTQAITNGNTLQVLGSGRLTSTVSATDKVTLSYSEVTTTLTYDSGTNILTYVNESGTTVNLSLNSFSCSNLNSCSINSMSDVNTAGATTGQVLAYNGASWVPTTVSVSGGGSFSCLSLSGCSASSLLDIIYPSGPNNGQALIWASSSNAFIPQDVFTSFTVSDGTTTQSITNGNTLRFSGGGDISVAVSATDRVAISFTEAVTTLTYNSGLNRLTYTDENGSATNINLVTSTGGGSSFTCTDLNSCSINSLSDVNTSTATSGKFLKYNGSQWAPSSLAVSTDANNSLTIGSDGNTYFNETTTTLTSLSGSYIRYTDEDGGQTDINICGLIGSCSINSLSDVTISSPSTNQILRWNGTTWVNSNESAAGSYSFTISDGSTSQTISNGNTLTFADSNCINATVSATDTVSFSPILAGSRGIFSSTFGNETFANALQCDASGLFVPCIEAVEPTMTTGTDRFILRIPCGSDWNEYTLPWFDNIKRYPADATAITDGDAAEVGVDLFIDATTGEFFYQDNASTYRKARGTYGYQDSSVSFTASTPKVITHNLNTSAVIVQVYLAGVLKYDCTIEDWTADSVRITTPSTASYKVCILPVYDL